MRGEPGHHRRAKRRSLDGRDPDRAHRHRAGAVRGVPADGVLRRLGRRDLPPVLDHDGRGDGAVGGGGAGAVAGARGHAAEAAERGEAARDRSARPASCTSTATGSSAGSSGSRIVIADRVRVVAGHGVAISASWPRCSPSACWSSCSCACRRASCRPKTRVAPSSNTRCRPARRCRARCSAVREIERYFLTEEKQRPDVSDRSGGGQAGAGQNAGRGFRRARRWDERKGKEHSAAAITQRATASVGGAARRGVLRARTAAGARPRPVERLHDGAAQHRRAHARRVQGRARQAAGRRRGPIRGSASVRSAIARRHADPERRHRPGEGGRARAFAVRCGLDAFGGLGRQLRQRLRRSRAREARVRAGRCAVPQPARRLAEWYVRTASGAMAPFSRSPTTGSTAPPARQPLQRLSSYEMKGHGAPGRSTGEAMDADRSDCAARCRARVDWAGLSYQERQSSGQAPYLYAISVIVVFLCLAALYESWSIPVSVIWSCPLGLVGASRGDVARAGERRLLPGGPADDDGACRRRTRS